MCKRKQKGEEEMEIFHFFKDFANCKPRIWQRQNPVEKVLDLKFGSHEDETHQIGVLLIMMFHSPLSNIVYIVMIIGMQSYLIVLHMNLFGMEYG